MPDTVVTTETAATEPVKNDAPATTQPISNDELERLRKERDQAEMRARQLEREAEDRRRQEDENKRKQLEQEAEYKTLYEREKEERERIQSEREAEQRRNDIRAQESSILSNYSAEVRDAAQELGVGLLDDSEESKTTFKGRLDSLQGRMGAPAPKIQGNNPAPVVATQTDEDVERQNKLKRLRYTDNPEARSVAEEARRDIFSNLDAIKEMKRNAGIQVDE